MSKRIGRSGIIGEQGVNRRWNGTPDWNAPLAMDSLQVGN
jgi:hypothetical protein